MKKCVKILAHPGPKKKNQWICRPGPFLGRTDAGLPFNLNLSKKLSQLYRSFFKIKTNNHRNLVWHYFLVSINQYWATICAAVIFFNFNKKKKKTNQTQQFFKFTFLFKKFNIFFFFQFKLTRWIRFWCIFV